MKKQVFGGANTILVGIVSAVFVALLGISIFTYFRQAKEQTGVLILADLDKLAKIFEGIELKCDILGFDNQKNPINFLTIKKDGFVGSEVGSMNIAYPKNWEGPYVQDNPTMHGIEYQIVTTKYGNFITPGDGVVLPNGKQIGKDIILNEDADIPFMMRDETMLQYQGKSLVVPIHIRLAPRELGPIFDQEVVQARQQDDGVRLANV
jgi:hypothetical protein